MPFCANCGSERNPVEFCVRCGSPPSSPANLAGIQGSKRDVDKPHQSYAGALIFLALGVISIVCPWFPFLSDGYNDTSLNGWDTADFLSNFDRFGSAPSLLIGCGIFEILVALIIIAMKQKGRSVSRPLLGLGAMALGLIKVGAIGATLTESDSLLTDYQLVARPGFGMWLGAVIGIATIAMGVVAWTVPSVTQSRR